MVVLHEFEVVRPDWMAGVALRLFAGFFAHSHHRSAVLASRNIFRAKRDDRDKEKGYALVPLHQIKLPTAGAGRANAVYLPQLLEPRAYPGNENHVEFPLSQNRKI